MRRTQQTLWLAGFTGVSTACIISFLTSNISSVDRQSVEQPDALLAANTDQDKLVTLYEVRQMLDGHFARLDADKDGFINPDEYAGQHINLFLAIDADSNQKLSPAEVRQHNLKGVTMKLDNMTKNQLYKTTYKKIEDL
ncbi:MAG: hypothetical protein CMM80_02320 [Rhodospirillaceae bacterium]|nr:hypothetical protein [Rhodospirillaceae bacterium]|tara:strand:+ start:129 stop:545 length:417 start_codon:yes stop_codon:yes gene_type:complete